MKARRLAPYLPPFFILLALHQDFWLWNDDTLVFGFVPAGLAYHIGYSIACAVFWAVVIRVAWPQWIEDEAAEDKPGEKEPERA